MRSHLIEWRRLRLALALSLILSPWMLSASEANHWLLASPGGHCVIAVSLDEHGSLSYQVWRKGKTVIQASPLGIRRDDQDFAEGLAFDHADPARRWREKYELFAGKTPHVNHLLSHRAVFFRSPKGASLEIDLAASEEGVAFRYRFPEKTGELHVVESERTGFSIARNALGWLQPFHAAGPYTPAYEDFFFHVGVGEPPPDSRAKAVGWAFPALFNVPKAETWALLTESGTDESYCACHLEPDSSDGIYHIAFPLADETTKGWTNKFPPQPRFNLPWTMPWRVIVLGGSAGDIAMSSLVTDLAPPSEVQDTSWIKAGRVSWAWWSHPDGPATGELFDKFTDLAADMGWEYTLFDAGWWEPGLSKISRYAQSKGVIPLAWLFAADFYEPEKRTRKLDEMAAAGIRGVKVDFWCSDRQEAVAAMQALFRDTASRRMLANIHGCTVPRGWQRTWPNLLTCEAVLGTESYIFEPHYTEKAAELNTVLPFTRNAIGPMDTTPVACSPNKYPRTTTAAHELATAIVLTSGLIHYADTPEFFASLPAAARQVLRDAPARWDETRCLAGDPGREAIFARRAGQSWFIAGLNGTSAALAVDLDLSAFARFSHRVVITEGVEAHMQVSASPLDYSSRWQHDIPPRGGFILRLNK
jgi:alpha-glucosidase